MSDDILIDPFLDMVQPPEEPKELAEADRKAVFALLVKVNRRFQTDLKGGDSRAMLKFARTVSAMSPILADWTRERSWKAMLDEAATRDDGGEWKMLCESHKGFYDTGWAWGEALVSMLDLDKPDHMTELVNIIKQGAVKSRLPY